MSVVMPIKEYLFLKDKFTLLDTYIVGVAIGRETVTLDFLNYKKESFKIEYRSMVMRLGQDGKETYNETGLHLNRIYEEYFQDEMNA